MNTKLTVIVGRFQTDELNSDICKLADDSIANGNPVLFVVGLSPLKATKQNPFDFETRKIMISERYDTQYMVSISYIKDCRDNVVWSTALDTIIQKTFKSYSNTGLKNIEIYGNQTTVGDVYSGVHTFIPFKDNIIYNDNSRRIEVGGHVKATADFRAGVLWATQNQYPKVYPTVDIAVFDAENNRILLARKPNEYSYRFVGGFVDVGENLSTAAIRELKEETNLDGKDPIFMESFVIDDWRYKSPEEDCITTSFFLITEYSGRAKPLDDIDELRYFDIDNDYIDIVPEHAALLEFLLGYLKNS